MLCKRFILSSPIHPLPSFCTSKCDVWVKRDDELSFGISGTKFRKYSTLLPYLVENRFPEAIVIGGPHSNNVVGITQMLIEQRIRPILFLREGGNNDLKGNRLLITLLGAEIRWIPRDVWKTVEEQANAYAAERGEKRCAVIPEGGNHPAAWGGALTLSTDITKNEEEHQIQFDHIIIDAGTGFSASALVHGRTHGHAHIVMLATPPFPLQPAQMCWTSYPPASARSFGATNATIFQEVAQLAREEGILTDPVYTGKLFHTARQIIPSLSGRCLIIHSGGALSLAGFQEQLSTATSSLSTPRSSPGGKNTQDS